MEMPSRYSQFLVPAMVCLLMPWLVIAAHAPISGTEDGSDQWGYIDVRSGAHMFWWLYRSRSQAANPTTIPVIMWLQGGPGASDVGIGDFGEICPLNNQLKPRAHMFWWLYCSRSQAAIPTMVQVIMWLQGGPGGSGVGVGDFREIGPLNDQVQPHQYSWVEIADLLFLENPVGTGFSYVDKPSLLPTNNTQVSSYLQFLKEFVKLHPDLSKRPLFIFSESYGGKYASELGVMIHKAIATSSLNLNFGGVALGDAWISPLDSMYSWGSFLQANSRLDATSVVIVNQNVDKTAALVRNGEFEKATSSWENVTDLVLKLSNQVNILSDDEAALATTSSMSVMVERKRGFRSYSAHFDAVKVGGSNGTKTIPLPQLMNTVIREKLGIIPASVRWETSSEAVFTALRGDFMKDTIHHVDELLHHGVKVAVYSGQLDLICSTPGTEAWIQKSKWSGLEEYNTQARTPLYCNSTSTRGFVKKHKNLSFYWILNAGHFLPVDSPCVEQQMVDLITS